MKTTANMQGSLPMYFPCLYAYQETEHNWQENSVLRKKVSNVKQILKKILVIPILMDFLTGNEQGEKAESDQKFSQHGCCCCLLLACS